MHNLDGNICPTDDPLAHDIAVKTLQNNLQHFSRFPGPPPPRLVRRITRAAFRPVPGLIILDIHTMDANMSPSDDPFTH